MMPLYKKQIGKTAFKSKFHIFFAAVNHNGKPLIIEHNRETGHEGPCFIHQMRKVTTAADALDVLNKEAKYLNLKKTALKQEHLI